MASKYFRPQCLVANACWLSWSQFQQRSFRPLALARKKRIKFIRAHVVQGLKKFGLARSLGRILQLHRGSGRGLLLQGLELAIAEHLDAAGMAGRITQAIK